MLELWVSPQMLLESEVQLVLQLVFTEPQTELLRDVCGESDKLLLTSQNRVTEILHIQMKWNLH